jgi:hypothetical protein
VTARWREGHGARRRPSLRAAAVGAALVVAVGCGQPRFVLPTGPAVPDARGAQIWTALVQPCIDVDRLRVELRVSGRVAGNRFPSLVTGLAVDADRVAIDARYGGRQVFNLAGQTERAVLLDHLERRVVRAPASAIVDALVGVRLTPDRLLALLTGCASRSTAVVASERVGPFLRVSLADAAIYLEEREQDWRVAGADVDTVLVDYRRNEDGTPRQIELRAPGVAVLMRIVAVDRNPSLADALFHLQVPAPYDEVPIDALRTASPLTSGGR